MKTRLLVPTLVAALALGGSILAQKATTSKVTKSTRASAAGKIDSYDPATKMLTVTTSKGQQRFTVGDAATVQQGSKKLTVGDLTSHTGEEAKVRYTEANGQKTVESITLAGQRAQKSSKNTSQRK